MSLARLRGSAPILATILAVVALLSGFAVATVLFLDERGTTGLTDELAARSGGQLALRVAFDRSADAAEQDAAVRAAIDRTFAPTGVSPTVTRALELGISYGVADAEGETSGGSGTAATIPDLASRGAFDTGAAPADDRGVAVQADVAASLGLQLGDELLIDEVPFTVSGTWRALDPLDPRWYGDDRVARGGGESIGPFAIDESAWDRLGTVPLATWTLVPEPGALTATNLTAVTSAWSGVQREWRGTVPEYESMEVEQRLSRTLVDFAVRIAGLRAIEPVAFILMTGSTLVALSQIVQLLVTTRERESALFWARGQSPAAVARRLTAEVAVSAVLGAVLGAAAVAIAAVALGRGASLVSARPIAVIVPAIVVVGATVLAAIAANQSARTISTPDRGGRAAARVRRVAVPGVVVLVTIGAALAVWQLRLYGSPLIPNASGYATIDPVAVAAPAAALVAVVLIGLAAFPAVVALVERGARRGGVRSHLTARSLAAYTRRVVAPLVVVALAVGMTTVAAAFSATWSTAFRSAAELYTGADLRVSSRFTPLLPSQWDAVLATPGVTAVAPLDSQNLSVGAVRGTTLSAAPEAVRQLVTVSDGSFSREEAASAISLPQPGPAVPEGAESLTLRVETRRLESPPQLSGWIVDPLGRLHPVPFGAPTVEDDGVLAYAADPDGVSGTLVALDVDGVFPDQEAEQTTAPSFRIVGLVATTATGDETLDTGQFWVPDSLSTQLDPPSPFGDGSGFLLDSPISSLRLTVSFNGSSSDELTPRLLVSEGLASALELGVGDLIVFSIRESDARLNGIVAGIVPSIPGAGAERALLVDLSIANHLRLRADRVPDLTTELWVATDDPSGVRDEIRNFLPADTVLESSSDPIGREILGAAPIALWAAALCCVLIAMIAVASASRSRLRWGAADIAALRAIGLSARDQSAVVGREMVTVLGTAALTGLVAGGAVTLLTVPQLVRAAVDRTTEAAGAVPTLDRVGLAALLGALALGIVMTMADQARRVRRLATTSLPEGDG